MPHAQAPCARTSHPTPHSHLPTCSGKYAQLFAENKGFSAEEAQLFDAAAQHAYESFRDKVRLLRLLHLLRCVGATWRALLPPHPATASHFSLLTLAHPAPSPQAAASRGMEVEAMQAVAQGRVWSGSRAAKIGLVDAVGGVGRALQLAKQAAGLAQDEAVRVLEVSRARTSPLALVTGGGASLGMLLLQTALAGGSAAQGAAATQAAAGAPLLLQGLLAVLGGGSGVMPMGAGLGGVAAGQVMAEMPDVAVEGVASQALLAAVSAGPAGMLGGLSGGTGGGLFDEE